MQTGDLADLLDRFSNLNKHIAEKLISAGYAAQVSTNIDSFDAEAREFINNQ